jgi:hypothetical protein
MTNLDRLVWTETEQRPLQVDGIGIFIFGFSIGIGMKGDGGGWRIDNKAKIAGKMGSQERAASERGAELKVPLVENGQDVV